MAKKFEKEPSYQDVMDISDKDLDDAIEFYGFTKKADKMTFDDEDHARKWLAEEMLELEPPKKKGGLSIGKKKDEDAELPSWKEVHKMDNEELAELVEANGLDISDEKFDDLEEAQDFVCKKLKIEEGGGGLRIGGNKGDKELPTWKEVSKMEADDLAALGAKHEVDLDKNFKDIDEAREYIAKEIGVKKSGLAGLK